MACRWLGAGLSWRTERPSRSLALRYKHAKANRIAQARSEQNAYRIAYSVRVFWQGWSRLGVLVPFILRSAASRQALFCRLLFFAAVLTSAS